MSFRSSARRRAMRKRRGRPQNWGLRVFLIFVVCASVLFVLAVLLGTYLRHLTEEPEDSYTPVTVGDAPDTGRFRIGDVPVILGEYFSAAGAAEDADTGTEITTEYDESVAAARSPVDWDAASLLLRVADTVPAETASSAVLGEEDSSGVAAPSVRSGTGMRLLYSSELAASRSFDRCGTENISDLLRKAREKHGYVSGVFEVMFQKEPLSSRSILREYELSLLCELFSCGIDDVVLTGFDSAGLIDAVAFVRELVGRTGGKARVGIALDFSYYEAEEIRSRINSLGYDCGFLALDLRGTTVPGLMSPADVVHDRVSRIASTVSLYSVRVLVGIGEEEGFAGEAAAAIRAGALNVQAAGKPAG